MIFIFGGAYAGKENYAKNTFGNNKKIIRDIHLLVRDAIKSGKNPYDEIERLTENNPDAVFISDETGCGIVPMDKLESEWRETVGRINCMLAERAEKVIRVVCGIGVTIK